MSVTFSPLNSRIDWDSPDGSWANLANGNAAALIKLLNLPDEGLYGAVKAEEVGSIRQRILVLLNKDSTRKPGIRQEERSSGPGRATVVSMGIDDDYLIRRLEALDKVLEACQQREVGMGWG